MINEKGFTLIELLVVVAIVGVITAVAVPNYINYLYQSRIQADVTTAREIAVSAEIYRETNKGALPMQDFVEKELEIYKTPESTAEGAGYSFEAEGGDVVICFTADRSKTGKYAGVYKVTARGDLPAPKKGGY